VRRQSGATLTAMPNLFRKSTLSDDITAAKKRLAVLIERRTDAKQVFDAAVGSREAFLIGGNLDDERTSEKHEAKVAAATSKVQGLDSAITAMQLQVDDLEAKLRLEVEATERNRVAGEIEENLASVEQQTGPWLASTRTFIASLAKLENLSFEINQVGLYLAKVVGEIELALSISMPDMHRHAEAIRSGGMMLPKYPRVEPELLELQANTATPTHPGEAVRLVFCLKPIRWRGVDGQRQFAERWSDAQLPERLIARATQRGAITLDMTHEKRRTHKGILSAFTGTPEHAIVDLDGSGEITASILPPGFEPLPGVGPPRTMSIKVAPARGTDEVPT